MNGRHPSRLGAMRLAPQGDGESSAVSLDYFIACGLIGEPVPPVMISGGPQKKNS
jgi:hypothetical protein